MASPKIKKKGAGGKASPLPQQGALPCLIIVAFILLLLGVFLYFSLRSTG